MTGSRLGYGDRLARQGAVALDQAGQDAPSRQVAYHALHQLGPGTDRRQPVIGAGSQGAGYLGATCQAGSQALDINLHQRPTARVEQPVSGCQGTGQRLPEYRDLHDHDLQCQPSRFYPEIHMKRRGAHVARTQEQRRSLPVLYARLAVIEYFLE